MRLSTFSSVSLKVKLGALASMVLVALSIGGGGAWYLYEKVSLRSASFQEISNLHHLTQNVSLLKANLTEVRLALLMFLNETNTEKYEHHRTRVTELSSVIDNLFIEGMAGSSREDINLLLKCSQLTWMEFQKTRDNVLIPAIMGGGYRAGKRTGFRHAVEAIQPVYGTGQLRGRKRRSLHQ